MLDKYSKIFSKNLKYLRKKHNMYQEELGSLIGISQQTVASYENNSNADPRLSVLVKLSNLFNVSIDDLVKKDLSKE